MVNRKKEAFSYFLGTTLLAILNFVISILYGDMFSPDDYGRYSLVFSAYSLLSQLAAGWVSAALIRYYVSHQKAGNSHKLVGSIFIQHLGFSIFEFVSILIATTFIPVPPDFKGLIITFSIFFFFESYVFFINTLMRVTNNSKQYNINTNLNSILKIATLLLFYYLFGIKNTQAIALSLLAAEVVQSVYLTSKYKFLKYFSPQNYDRKILLKLLKYGIPLIGVSVTNWILNVSDRYIIEYFYSSHEVGLYSYSYNIANSVINLLSQFIMLGAYPNIIRAYEEEGEKSAVKLIKDYLTLYVFIIVPFCFGFLCAGKQFFETFTNERYWGGYINFIVTGFGIAVLGLSMYTNKVWELKKKTTATLILSLIAAAVNIALNFWLIPKFGYTLGSVTTLISYVIYLVLSLIFSRKYMKLKANWSKIARILLAAAVMSAVITLMNCIPVLNNVTGFILKVVIGGLTYILITTATKVTNLRELKATLIKKI